MNDSDDCVAASAIDACATWKRINDDKHQWAGVNCVTGHMPVFGRAYLNALSGGIVTGNPE